MPSLNLNLFPDGFAVCNPRNAQLDLNAELGLELGAHNVKVLLAQSRKYLLVGLVVGGLGNGGILFDNAVESGDYLIFIAPLLGSYAHGKGGSGEIYSSCGNNIAGGAEGIAGFGAREFRNRADISGRNYSSILSLCALYKEELTDSFGLSRAGVDKLAVGGYLTRNDLEIGPFTDLRIGDGFEYDGDGGSVFIRSKLDGFIALLSRFVALFKGRGGVVYQSVQQKIDALEGQPCTAVNGSKLARFDGGGNTL